jgi:3-methyladenine DNA glycosylase AlkD
MTGTTQKVNTAQVLAWLQRQGSTRNVEGMARFGIRPARAFGVSMPTIQRFARESGRNHELATALWKTGWHEARLLAAFVADPQLQTRREMNAWAGDFDNWAVCDNTCVHLFSRTPFAWEKSQRWSRSPREFVKRAGFTLMAALAVHDKAATDESFLALLNLVEREATDGRHFVMKAVNWALRQIGKRNCRLHAAALNIASRLSEAEDSTSRWVGRDACRELASPHVRLRMARKNQPARRPVRKRSHSKTT